MFGPSEFRICLLCGETRNERKRFGGGCSWEEEYLEGGFRVFVAGVQRTVSEPQVFRAERQSAVCRSGCST